MSSNKYESFRQDIIALCVEHCVRESDDKASISYTWNIAKVFSECGRLIGLAPNAQLPDELKTIVRFEFNKLRDGVMLHDGWTHIKSREGFNLTLDGIVKRRAHTYQKDALTLEQQLFGARSLLNRLEKSMGRPDLTSEQLSAMRKRRNRILREIDGLVKAQELQAAAIAEAAGAKEPQAVENTAS